MYVAERERGREREGERERRERETDREVKVTCDLVIIKVYNSKGTMTPGKAHSTRILNSINFGWSCANVISVLNSFPDMASNKT